MDIPCQLLSSCHSIPSHLCQGTHSQTVLTMGCVWQYQHKKGSRIDIKLQTFVNTIQVSSNSSQVLHTLSLTLEQWRNYEITSEYEEMKSWHTHFTDPKNKDQRWAELALSHIAPQPNTIVSIYSWRFTKRKKPTAEDGGRNPLDFRQWFCTLASKESPKDAGQSSLHTCS